MNPHKKYKKSKMTYHHRLIIVVFIPSQDGYYKNIFDVLKLCLKSAITTKNEKCGITVVNNASCKDVEDYLNDIFSKNCIDSLVHHKTNLGKIDALIGAARGCREPLITLSDIDILFKKGWQEAIEEIFSKIKNVGSVSPISSNRYAKYCTVSSIQKILLKKVNFSFEPIPENFIDHNRNLSCTNWKLDKHENVKWPVVKKNKTKAILGSPHQILTIRRELLFTNIPFFPSYTLIGGNSEYTFCDLPIDMSGSLRLATYRNFAYHMGNKLENWMLDVQKENKLKLKEKNNAELKLPDFKPKSLTFFQYNLKKRFFISVYEIFIAKN